MANPAMIVSKPPASSRRHRPFAAAVAAAMVISATAGTQAIAAPPRTAVAGSARLIHLAGWHRGWGWRGGWGWSGGWGWRRGGSCCWGGYPGYFGYYAPAYPPPPAYTTTIPQQLPQSFDLSVQFATGSAELTPLATNLLDQLGQRLTDRQLSADRFRIEGHTDTVGSKSYNLDLSQRRTDAVAHYLESKFNISSDRLQAVGVGENDLLIPTPDQTPELRNRRVHIVNLGS